MEVGSKLKEDISGWTLFSLRGVVIRLHVSLLFLLFYVVLVAMIQFPFVIQRSNVNINDVSGSPFIWAVIFSLALVISIFIHEFGHVLMAQAKGLKVRAITLMMLGGASQMEEFPEEPATEFKVAIIGPLVSLGIAGVLFWIRDLSSSANVDFFCYWVGQTNLILGIFNLLPAFPMDGGRVFRAFLVTRQGHLQGTRTAVKVSQVFAWIFGIIGFLQFNFLLILIALFLYAAAKSEYFVVMAHALLKGLRARDLMISLPSISENATISEAVSKMVDSKKLLLPVVQDADLPSLVTADLLKRIPKNTWSATRIKDIKIDFPKVIHPDDPLEDVMILTLKTAMGGLPVVQDNQLVGVVRTSDIIETIALRQLTEEESPIKPWSLRGCHAYPK